MDYVSRIPDRNGISSVECWYFARKGIQWSSAPRSARRFPNSSGSPPRLSSDCFASVDATRSSAGLFVLLHSPGTGELEA
jgi:hypothetical protein